MQFSGSAAAAMVEASGLTVQLQHCKVSARVLRAPNRGKGPSSVMSARASALGFQAHLFQAVQIPNRQPRALDSLSPQSSIQQFWHQPDRSNCETPQV